MSTYLHEDVVVEILSRLSVKTLLRFRCVCKSWCALIRNPKFISKQFHFSNNANNKDARFMVPHQPNLQDNPILSLLCFRNEKEPSNDLASVSVSVSSLNLDVLFHYNQSSMVLGPCSGIYFHYCLSVNRIYPFILFNPATREIHTLPRCSIHSLSQANFGFGLDPKTNDYKVIRIAWMNTKSRVEIYNLSCNSWRELGAPVPSVAFVHFETLCIDEFIYWLAYEVEPSPKRVILSFDMSNEVFHTITLPVFDKTKNRSLAVLNESLALVVYDGLSKPENSYEIWVMNKYGGAASCWTKQFTSGPPIYGVGRSLGFAKNGALLLERNHPHLITDGRLVLYEIPWNGFSFATLVPVYEESLVELRPQ